MTPYLYSALVVLFAGVVTSLPAPLAEPDNMVDMTHNLVGNDEMPKWPGHKKYTFTIENRGNYHGTGLYVELNSISLSEHTATHMDAAAHLGKPGNRRVHQIPQRDLVSEAVVVDIREKAKANREAELTVDDLKKWESKYGRIPNRAFVFMNSGWEQYWTNKTAFLGTKSFDDMNSLHYPGVSESATRWLIDERHVLAIGVDTISLDPSSSTTAGTHRYLLGEKNLFGFEMVANLNSLPPRGATVFAFPMKIYDGSGAPLRMFAFWNNAGCEFQPSAPLLVLIVLSVFLS
ncbi:isatin hydrolase-like [Lineus longissimus]|uniref:isatin hydrolase-like n=1 Tax=Lineus longissimus TaxID=88925 RepID=UPI002B4E9F9F